MNIQYAGNIAQTNTYTPNKAVPKEYYEIDGELVQVQFIYKKWIVLSNGNRYKKQVFNKLVKAVKADLSINPHPRRVSCKVLKDLVPNSKDMTWYNKWECELNNDPNVLTMEERWLGYYRDKYIVAIDFRTCLVHIHNYCSVRFNDVLSNREHLVTSKYILNSITDRTVKCLKYKGY
jgi:hypothetical protein